MCRYFHLHASFGCAFNIYIKEVLFSCFCFGASNLAPQGSAIFWLAHYQSKMEMYWLMMYSILCRMALFISLLMQTAWHKMAALIVTFAQIFDKQDKN